MAEPVPPSRRIMTKKIAMISTVSTNIGIRLFQPLGAFSPLTWGKPFFCSRSNRSLLSFSKPLRGVWKATLSSGFGPGGLRRKHLPGHGAGDLVRPDLEVVQLRIADRLLLAGRTFLNLDGRLGILAAPLLDQV